MTTERYITRILPTRIVNRIAARKIDPITVATQAADLAQYRLVQDRVRQIALPEIAQAASYIGYDADAESHLVQVGAEVRSVQQLLTTAGLSAGQPVEFQNQALDSTPRTRAGEDPDFVVGEESPLWAVLLEQRRFIGAFGYFIPPVPARIAPSVPASWMVTYIASFGGTVDLSGWNAAAVPRYRRSGSVFLCQTDRPTNPYRQINLNLWDYNFNPLTVVDDALFTDARCHLELRFDSFGAGIVVAGFFFSPDGFDAPPSPDPTSLPRVFRKDSGAEENMGWQLIEKAKLSNFVPPMIERPAFPGGFGTVDRFETVLLLYTDQGVQEVAVIPDSYEELEGGIKPDIEALISISGGDIFVDVKIKTKIEATNQTVVTLRHFQPSALPPNNQLKSATNWRRNWTNSTTDLPLPLPYSHPCQQTFQQSPQTNFDESSNQLYIADFADLRQLRLGLTHKTKIYNLDSSSLTCNLPVEADAEIEIEIPPLDFMAGSKDNLRVRSILTSIDTPPT